MSPSAIVAKQEGGTRRASSLVSMLVFVRVSWSDGSVSHEEFDAVTKWFSEHVVEWLDHHYPQVLTVNVAVRWGLVDQGGCCVQYTDDNSVEYQVACCLIASGKYNGWEKGKYYMSASKYREPSSFWQAPLFTISSIHPTSQKALPDVSCRYNIRTNAGSTLTIDTSWEAKARFLEDVDKWCMANIDRAYDLTASGARSPSDKAEKSGLLTADLVYCKTTGGDCVLASIINMLFTEEGPTIARRALDVPPSCSSRRLGTFNTWLQERIAALRDKHRLRRTYTLSCLREENGRWPFEPTEFIANAKAGKYIVRLSGFDDDCEEVDHTIFVDADRQLVFDCMEKRALRLCHQALECCVGDAILVGVMDVRAAMPAILGTGHRQPRRKKRTREEA